MHQQRLKKKLLSLYCLSCAILPSISASRQVFEAQRLLLSTTFSAGGRPATEAGRAVQVHTGETQVRWIGRGSAQDLRSKFSGHEISAGHSLFGFKSVHHPRNVK